MSTIGHNLGDNGNSKPVQLEDQFNYLANRKRNAKLVDR